MRPLKNSLFCHSGLDPESRKWLKILDSAFRRNDKRDKFPALFKGLKMLLKELTDILNSDILKSEIMRRR